MGVSVLKNKRCESKAEFVNTANSIYDETLAFLTRLSARYARLLAQNIINLATEIADHCEKGNSIFPSDNVRKELRERHFLEARASLMALDVHLTRVYGILIQNPQGAFTTASGNVIHSNDAVKRLDNMAQSLGEKIDNLNRMLTELLKSDKRR